jgi:hypothetical protein
MAGITSISRVTGCDEEKVGYEINGKHIITANHDDHGWSGMETIEMVFEAFAKELGIVIDDKEDDEV